MRKFAFSCPIASGAALTLCLSLAAGCRALINKNRSAHTKNVRVETPFGGLSVKTGEVTAADLGLPVYPGAVEEQGNDGDKSANVHIGFGGWRLQVKAVGYRTTDSEDKVLAFYRAALGRFGNVIRCRDDRAVGTPAATDEGLTCSDTGKPRLHIHGKTALEAGSPHHQHVMVIDSGGGGSGTRFSLVDAERPEESTGD